ncbi:MarR family transcriptional regulator [Pseudonocardia sediminis]|uniref:MarR family transcriptional regulator n=1 Tax=Pseudonocardia sediminis TaxID=1397368 RepID=A0A4Q7UZV5_PSEST|nr:MarR family transcriptional regulator [Pseudonocardia sediminis]RZT85833.1 MarR family transcriptional regulator [Pseudonocardia sediminis]
MTNRTDESPAAAAVADIVRWGNRGDVRAAMVGEAGRDLSANDIALLRSIVVSGPVRVSDLAELHGVDKSTVTPQVQRLERRGLVERGPDAGDRRAVRLSATTAGTHTWEEINRAGQAVYEHVLASWTEQERATFESLIDRFARELITGTSDWIRDRASG